MRNSIFPFVSKTCSLKAKSKRRTMQIQSAKDSAEDSAKWYTRIKSIYSVWITLNSMKLKVTHTHGCTCNVHTAVVLQSATPSVVDGFQF